jgi:hypothetical protein
MQPKESGVFTHHSEAALHTGVDAATYKYTFSSHDITLVKTVWSSAPFNTASARTRLPSTSTDAFSKFPCDA